MIEILRCPECGFRIKGFPAQYMNRRAVECPQCRMVTSLSIEDRLRLKRLLVEEGETAARQTRERPAA
jgi:DNA-directed RNA polymerase subunit RPC12/RpoP